MKEIMAIIRMNMVNKTKEALSKEGYPGITCRKVFGRGKKKVSYKLTEDILEGEKVICSNLGEALSEEHRLLPKRLFTIIVKDEDVKNIVNTIIEVNQTGSMGDGKIFVLPVADVIRVRTSESGDLAI
jgi:nitrogen regulatory protein PII 2